MPSTSNRHASITVCPGESRAVVTLGGDLDMQARPELDDAVHHLAVAAPDRIDVDVSAVAYVGAVLPNFLAQVRKVMPAECVLTVSRPSPSTLFILRLTGMTKIAKIEEAV